MNSESDFTHEDELDWERIKNVVADAMQKPASQWESFLREACDHDPRLIREVRSLLGASQKASGFLESSPLENLEDGSEPRSEVGRELGPYRITRPLGEGGFGVVYHATQKKPIERVVALKILKPGMDTRQILARFESEKKTLAMMNHPHIAKVLDAGETPEGRPFFVMEFVEGDAITRFCDTEQLDLAQRLRLFIQVCEAVQHAHQKGIIHRDLKPSNVLVQERIPSPECKVIDFGIAKAMDSDGEESLVTHEGVIVGTPNYMSPEQAGLDDLDIDTRTDIYSLGVLLYEILVGGLPFDRKSSRGSSFDDIRRLIREVEPQKPSLLARASSPSPDSKGPSKSALAAARKTTPAGLEKQIRGDLDWIVLKAMDKDRDRRYASASQLARDIERHLQNEPVKAGPPSSLYRLKKYAIRNRLWIATLSAVGLALISGTLLAVAGFVEAKKERDLARSAETNERKQRTRAEDALEEAEAITAFLEKTLRSARADVLGRDAKVMDVLDEAAADLATLDRRPTVTARLHRVIGLTYQELGEYERSNHHFEESLRTLEKLHGPLDPRAIEAEISLIQLRFRQSRNQEASQRLGEVRRKLSTLSDPYLNRQLTTLLAAEAFEAGRFEEAAQLFEQSIEERGGLAENIFELRTAASNLTTTWVLLGEHEKARALAREVWDRCLESFGPDHPETLHAGHALGTQLSLSRNFEEGVKVLEQVIEARKRALGPFHQNTLASQTLLAYNYQQSGRTKEAEDLYRYCIEQQEKELGLLHRQTITVIHNLGMLLINNDQVASGIESLRMAFARWEQLRGRQHVHTSTTGYRLAEVLAEVGPFEEAFPLFFEMMDILHQETGFENPTARESRRSLARSCQRAWPLMLEQDLEELAQSTLVEAWELLDGFGDEEQSQVLVGELVALYERLGNEEEAAFWRDEIH